MTQRTSRDQRYRGKIRPQVIGKVVDGAVEHIVHPMADADRIAVCRCMATRPTPIDPPAPLTFSMTTVSPSETRMRSAMMQPIPSVGPPAEARTIIVIGRDG
jgi:hypothetical protein